MAKVIQLKNENGETYYPVTTGEAVKLVDGKTIDEKFGEYGERLDGMDESLSNKAGVYNITSGSLATYDAEFPIGTILLVALVEKPGYFFVGDKINIVYARFSLPGGLAGGADVDGVYLVGSPKSISASADGAKGRLSGYWVALSSTFGSSNAVLVQRVE